MAVRKIRTIGDPVLRVKCEEVKKIDKEILSLVEDMVDTISDDASLGVGLAAPQIGVSKRVVIALINDKFEIFINPVYSVIEDSLEEDEEGCLSVYSVKCPVKRPSKIKVEAIDLKGTKKEFVAEGILARIFQHEIDHLNGILLIDHLEKKTKRDLMSKINDLRSK